MAGLERFYGVRSGPPPLGPESVEFGRQVRRFRDTRQWQAKRVARACGVPEEVYAKWETGHDLPSAKQWARLKGVLHALANYSAQYQRARAEQGFREEAAAPATTNLGEKLREAAADANGTLARLAVAPALARVPEPAPVPVPPPAPPVSAPVLVVDEEEEGEAAEDEEDDAEDEEDEERADSPQSPQISLALRALPDGWKVYERRTARRNWVRDAFVKAPNTPVSHMQDRVRAHFGVGVRERDIAAIRDEVTQVLAALGRQQPAPAPAEPEPVPAPAAAPELVLAPVAPPPLAMIRTVPPTPRAEQELSQVLETATQLVLEAIPMLTSFSITVADDGAVDVAYTVREVVKHSGSLSFGKRT